MSTRVAFALCLLSCVFNYFTAGVLFSAKSLFMLLPLAVGCWSMWACIKLYSEKKP